MIEITQLNSHSGIFAKAWDAIAYFAGRIDPVWQIIIVSVFCLSLFVFMLFYIFDKLKLSQMISLSIIPPYILLILVLTIFIRLPNNEVTYEFMPIWSYIEMIKYKRVDLLIDNLFNLCIFVPLGFLVMSSFSPKKKEWRAFRILLLLTLLFSLSIEISQLITRHGCCETDDIINNLIGSAIGGIIYMIFHQIVEKIFSATEDKK
ncbi:MAG: VanZ family protein [Ruminococcus sp.]|nr:VanZ family protein [Ruminococcus sp.]